MKASKNAKRVLCSLLGALCVTGAALACGTPPTEPPQPPAPPVVCCKIVSWYIDPICPGREVVIICYWREDGLPLFLSNPMPLPASQQCACGLGALPQLPGVMDAGIAFGPAGGPPAAPCIPFPPDVPGYGPFTPVCNPQVNAQVDSFFDIWYELAQIPRDPTAPCPRLSSVFQFRGSPNHQIPPGQAFGLYRKVVIPSGFDPNQLCGFGLTTIGLFLVDNGTVLLEPGVPMAAGGAPIPLPLFPPPAGTPGGTGAILKVKCLPFDLLTPCPVPPGCPGDANGDGITNFSDINAVLANWLIPCP